MKKQSTPNQHQSEPVTLPEREQYAKYLPGVIPSNAAEVNARKDGWNACLDEIAKLGPLYPRPVQGEPVAFVDSGCLRNLRVSGFDSFSALLHREQASMVSPQRVALYTHADPGEVERLHKEHIKSLEACSELSEKQRDHWMAECKKRDTQLAERDELLHLAYQLLGLNNSLVSYRDLMTRITAALSASAEPSAPVPLCSTCKGYGKYQDGDSGTDEDGRCPNIVECECDDSERMPQYRASAPVGRDERAAFEADWVRRKKAEGCRERANAFYRIQPNDRYRWNDVQDGWDAWQARAALERNP